MNGIFTTSADTADCTRLAALLEKERHGDLSIPFPKEFRSPHALTGFSDDTPLLLGFSGGIDSSVLLFLTYFYAKKHGTPLRLVHLHHGLRGEEADRDAEFAKRIAELYGLPITLVYKDVNAVAREHGESIETAARNVRYEVFDETMREFDLPILLTAHNADDNLETVLFHFLRGSGLSGLCGIPPVRTLAFGSVVRPILELSRREIVALSERYGIPFVFDSTNDDTAYTRNKLRTEVIPLLREISPAPEAAASRLTASLRRDKALIDELASDLLKKADTGAGLDRSALRDAPDAVALRALLSYWQNAIPHLDSYSSVHLDALLDFVRHGRNGTHLSLRSATARLENGRLLISPPSRGEKESSAFSYVLTDGVTPLPELGLSVFFGPPEEAERFLSKKPAKTVDENAKNIYNSETKILLSFDTIEKQVRGGLLTVRSRLPGDRILSRGMHRSLRTLLHEARLPLEERKHLPIVTLGDEILWIPGIAVRDGLRATDATDGSVKLLVLFPTAREEHVDF